MTTVSEAAEQAAVTRQAVQAWCRTGTVRAAKQRGHWEVDPDSLAEHLDLVARVFDAFTDAGGTLWTPAAAMHRSRRVYLNDEVWHPWSGLRVELKADTALPHAAWVDGRRVTDVNGGTGQIMLAVQDVFLDAADLSVHIHGYNDADKIPIVWPDTGRSDHLDLTARIAAGVTAHTGWSLGAPEPGYGRRDTPVGCVLPVLGPATPGPPEEPAPASTVRRKPSGGTPPPSHDAHPEEEANMYAPRDLTIHPEGTAETTPRRRMCEVMGLVDQTPGWETEAQPDGGFRITGPGRFGLTTVPDPGDEVLATVQLALKAAGWTIEDAQEEIARRDALYTEARHAFPPGGYPTEDRIITRADARALIEVSEACGCNWRPPKKSRIREYAKSMGAGKWPWMHPQPLILSAEHQCVLDGLQRLKAFLRSGLSQMGFRFTLGVPRKEFKYLDQGSSRSVSDILAGEGLSSNVRSKVGPAVALAVRFDSGTPWKSWKDIVVPAPDFPGLIQASDPEQGIPAGPYAEMPGKPYGDAVSLGWDKRDSTGCKMVPSVAAALSFLVRRDLELGGIPHEVAYETWEEFRTALVYGEDLHRSDARRALRNQLIGRDVKVERRYGAQVQLGAALVAWAYWYAGVPAEQIQFRENQKMPKVWLPGMPLPGTDPRRGAAARKLTQARKLAAEAGVAVPEEPEEPLQPFDFDGQ